MIDYLMHEIHPLLSILVMMGAIILVSTIGIIGMHLFHGKKYGTIPYFLCYLMTWFVPDIGALLGTSESIGDQVDRELNKRK